MNEKTKKLDPFRGLNDLPVNEIAQKHGITVNSLLKSFKELSQADTEKPFCTKDGEVVYSKPLKQLDINLRAVIELAKIIQIYPVEKHKIESEGGFNVFFKEFKKQKE